MWIVRISSETGLEVELPVQLAVEALDGRRLPRPLSQDPNSKRTPPQL